MTKRYKLIKDLPFQKADNSEWETEERFEDPHVYFTKGNERFIWYAGWGSPLKSGFFEEVKPTRWRANEGRAYWLISNNSTLLEACEDLEEMDEHRNELGNYFRTEADAQIALDKYIRPAFDAAHTELGY